MSVLILPFGDGGGAGEGERDIAVEEVFRSIQRLFSCERDLANAFIIRIQATGARRFFVGRFLTLADRNLPAHDRAAEIWGGGDSFAEALRRARARQLLRQGPLDPDTLS